MKKTALSTTLLISLLTVPSVYAESAISKYAKADNSVSKYAVTGRISTLGIGMDVTYPINPKVNARFNINKGNIDDTTTEDGVNYDVELDLFTIGGLVDYHPKAGNFRLSAGLYNNRNELNLTATGTNNNADIGNRAYNLTGTKLGTDVDFNSIAPYLGIGWGNAIKTGSKWRFSFDAGVLFQGSPDAKITASGNAIDLATTLGVDLATDATFQAELAKEEANLNDDLKDFKLYPVVSLGASYRF